MENKLIKLLMSFFKITEEEAKNASMESVSNWDSLNHIELMMTLEEEFDISKIIPDEIVFMVNIENIKKILNSKGLVI